jgi:ABC-type branched-subunit amino acid transport system substrate-binding protein
MNNVKQNYQKWILRSSRRMTTLVAFCCLFIISGCNSMNESSTSKKTASHDATEIAILVPLSGENAVIGKQYAGLVKMGLASGAKSKIRVTSYDSADEANLRESIKKILEQKINIIIGPIYSRETKAIALQVKNHDVVVVSLSNDPTLADENVFVFGHAPMRQMEQMTDYLLNNDYKNYITLLPAGRYSQTVSQVIHNRITTRSGVVSKSEFYTNSDEDITKAVKIVNDTVDHLNEQEDNLKQPVILVGDDPENLKRIYRIAKGFNLDKKAVIAGDNRLDVDLEEPFDITYTGSIKIDNSNLKQKAAALGVTHFSFMHALAYDAGNLVASSITPRYNKEAFLQRLRTPVKWSGLSGKIYFVDSIAQREYEIIKKQNNAYTILTDLAPMGEAGKEEGAQETEED